MINDENMDLNISDLCDFYRKLKNDNGESEILEEKETEIINFEDFTSGLKIA